MIKNAETKLAVIGLRYVGLLLAIGFGKKMEVSDTELAEAAHLSYSSNVDDLLNANVYIVTVPILIDKNRTPDLTPLIIASRMLDKVGRKGDVVPYESGVYTGATEEDCIPLIEEISGLSSNKDFYAGYSPERIDPGYRKVSLPLSKSCTTSPLKLQVISIIWTRYRRCLNKHKGSRLLLSMVIYNRLRALKKPVSAWIKNLIRLYRFAQTGALSW